MLLYFAGHGYLQRDEFEKMIVSYMKPMWQVEEELKDAFRIFDKDGNGRIDTAGNKRLTQVMFTIRVR